MTDDKAALGGVEDSAWAFLNDHELSCSNSWRCTKDNCGCYKDLLALLPAQRGEGGVGGYIDIVFDGPPSQEGGRFVEVENSAGKSINVGEWIKRPDGYWALRIAALPRSTEGERYERLSSAFGELQQAAWAVIKAADNGLDTKKPPFKFTAPWAALAKLRELLLANAGLRPAPAAGAERRGEEEHG